MMIDATWPIGDAACAVADWPRGSVATSGSGRHRSVRTTFRRAVCEHMFVSVRGSPYVRFKRALATGNLSLVRAAAAELPAIDLGDALAICLLMSDRDDERFERAAVRWLARLALERPAV